MGWLNKFLSKDSNKEQVIEPVNNDPVFRDEYISDSLSLGWHYSENKNEYQMAKIADKDRATHCYVVGATGAGKTKFLEFLIQQDIEKRNGFGVIDPHGDLIEDTKGLLANFLEDELLAEKVILINPADPEYTVSFNPLERLPNVSIAEQANELTSVFKKVWSDSPGISWGVRMEDLMRNSLVALGEAELTLVDLPYFLTQKQFRQNALEKVNNPIAKEYFYRYNMLSFKQQISWIEPVMNKIDALFADEKIRQIFASKKSSFQLREIIDNRKILLVKLDKGKLKDSADLIGSLIMAKIQMAAFSRSDIPLENRIPFYLYIDEFQNFASESFSVVLSEARKYGLSLIMAHQSLLQVSRELRSLILGNSGIQVYFRVNREDAEILAKEGFEYSGYEVKTQSTSNPTFWGYAEEWEHYFNELQTLPPQVCYVKHKIQGGMIPLHTVQLETTSKTNNSAIGQNYLIPRENLIVSLEEKQAIIKENIVQKKPRTLPEKQRKPEISIDEKDEKEFLKYLSDNKKSFVSKTYKALGLSGYKGDKIKASLIKRGFISQQETRDGKAGRLAKTLSLTDKGHAYWQAGAKASSPTAIVSEKRDVSYETPFQKQLLDTNEASLYLGISKNTLYEWIVQKKIPHIKVGRLTKFKKAELEIWLNKRAQKEGGGHGNI